jgi:DNA polymerase alpha subunit B
MMMNLCLFSGISFYPIFPPPLDLSHEVNLDFSHFDDVRMVDEGDLDYAPDVLILPSRLKQFSKVCQTTFAMVVILTFL